MRTSTFAPRSSTRHKLTIASALLALTVLGQGCLERALRPIAPCTRSAVQQTETITATDQVDLLFMIDDSGSMAEEQRAIGREIPRIVEILTTGNLPNGTHVAPARSLHVGVVSSNMGIGSSPTQGTCHPGLGGDGLLVPAGACTGASANGSRGSIFDFQPATGDATAFSAAVACVASLGTNGCGYEQQLEAVLKAVSPSAPTEWTAESYVAPTFWGLAGPTFGHGGPGGANETFVRPGSVLAIVLVTDEDDCSASDPALFAADAPSELRCARFRSMQHSVERYVDGLVGLRAQPSQLVFAAIVGIPRSSPETSGLTEAELLDLPDMEETENEAGDNLEPSCEAANPANGVAYPPRRIVQVAEGLRERGASTSLHSICDADFRAAADDIVERISGALGTACLPRELNLDAQGYAPCDVFELLPPVEGTAELTHCADLPNADAYELDHVESRSINGEMVHREACRVRQVARDESGAAAGWFYDDGEATIDGASALPPGCNQGIAFSMVQVVSGAELQFECEQTILPSTGAPVQLGSFCDPGTGEDESGLLSDSDTMTCSMGIATPGYQGAHLRCDSFDRTCQMACTATSDCTAAGLLGYVCDLREAQEVFGDDLPSGVTAADVHGFCVNPTCHED